MKLKLDRQSLEAFGTICRYAYNIEFEDMLLQRWLRRALESLIIKLKRAKDRIVNSKTLRLNESEALALKYGCMFWVEASPNSLEAVIAINHYLSPLKAMQ